MLILISFLLEVKAKLAELNAGTAENGTAGVEAESAAEVADQASNNGVRFKKKSASERRDEGLTEEQVNEQFNIELDEQIKNGEAKPGHVYFLGMPSVALLSAGVPNLPIELSASRLQTKASAEYVSNHPFDLEEIKDLLTPLLDR